MFRSTFCRFALLVLLVCCAPESLLGQTQDLPKAQESGQQTMLASTLAQFMPEPRPIDLRGVGPEYTLPLPVAKRLDIRRARLFLRATNSVSLARRSQLQIRVNDQVVAQVSLSANAPLIDAVIDLPVQLLKPGFNRLVFAAALHYTEECEDPSSPELWVQIDTNRSRIELEGDLRGWQPKLSELDAVFDPKLWGEHRYTLLTAGPIDAAHLKIGGLAAQGIALRLSYVPPELRHGIARALPPSSVAEMPHRLDTTGLAQGDAVLFGTRDELASFLPPETLTKIDSGFLAIYPLTAQRKHHLLVISGRNPSELEKAARAFAQLNYPFPDTVEGLITRVDLPRLRDYAAENTVYPNSSYTFSELGLFDKAVSGIFTEPLELHINVPAPLYAPQDAHVELRLDFAYGAGLREDSVFNILLNGRFENVIRLNEPRGGYYEDYVITIPLRSFRPGHNVISFVPSMMPLITGKCQAIQTGNLKLTLFGRSRLVMPNAAYQVTMPDLSLLARGGFPYTVKHGGNNVSFRLTAEDSDTVSAAWMLLGKLAQQSRLALDEVQFSLESTPTNHELFVIGPAQGIDSGFLQAAPLRMGNTSQSPYPLPAGPGATEGERGWLIRLGYFFSNLFHTGLETTPPNVVWLTQRGRGLGEAAALMQFQSPYAKNKTVTLLTAETGQRVRDAAAQLIRPEYWGQLSGDLAVWKHGDTVLATQRAGASYTVGEAGLTLKLVYIYSRHPMFWLVSFALLTLVLAALATRALMRFKARRHAHVQEEKDDVA